MVADAGHLQVIICAAGEYFYFAEGIEAGVKNITGKDGYKQGYHCVGGKRGGPYADGGECSAQQEKPQIGTDDAAIVERAVAGGERRHGDVIHDGGYQRYQHDQHAGGKFSPDDLPPGDGLGTEKLHRAAFKFVCKTAHGDGRYQQQKDHRRQLEKPVQVGIAQIEQVRVLENEKEERIGQQEQDDGHIAGDAAEKLVDLFFKDC